GLWPVAILQAVDRDFDRHPRRRLLPHRARNRGASLIRHPGTKVRMSTYKALRKLASAAQAGSSILAALREIPLAALSDNMHRNIGTVGLQPYHRPGAQTMAGTAVTARSRGGDNLTYLRALEFCRPGDVLVIDAGSDLNNAVVGGILSFYAATI